MKNQRYIALAAIALFAAAGAARADEADGSQSPIKVQSVRARADVRNEALRPQKITNGGTGVHAMGSAAVSREEVRTQAALALKNGEIGYGEMGSASAM